MKKALRSILSLALLLALPTTLTAQVTTFDNKLITISQQQSISSSTPYYLSSSNYTSSGRAKWTTTNAAENIFFYDATNKKLVSLTTGTALQVTDATSGMVTWSGDVADAEVSFYESTNTSYSGTYNIVFQTNSSGSRYLYNNNSEDSNGGSSVNMDGYYLTVSEATAPSESFTNALASYFTKNAPTLASTYGSYHTEKFNALVKTLQSLSTEASFTEISNALNDLFVTKSYKTPQTNSFMRIRPTRSGVTDYYLANENSSSKSNRAAYVKDNGESAQTIFFFDGTHLTNYYSGFNLADNGEGQGFLDYDGEVDGSTISFLPSVFGTEGYFHVMYKDGTRSLYCADTGYADGAGVPDATSFSGGYANWQFTLESVTSLPVTVSSAGYATFVAPVPVTIPSGVEAYTFDETPKTGYVKVRQVTGTIPANFGIYIKAAEGTYYFTIASSADEQTSLLTGNIRTKTIDATKTYIFANKNSKVGFYLLNPSGNRQVHGSRAYYQPTDQAEAVSAFIIDEGSVTGIIDAIATDATDSNIYDLQGRRIATPTKGLYIKGGKKIYVK